MSNTPPTGQNFNHTHMGPIYGYTPPIDRYEQENRELRLHLRGKENELHQLGGINAGLITKIADLQRTIEGYKQIEQENRTLKEQLRGKERDLQELQTGYAKLQDQARIYRDLIKSQKGTINSQEKNIETLTRLNSCIRVEKKAYENMKEVHQLLCERNMGLVLKIHDQKKTFQAQIDELQKEIDQQKDRILQLELASIDRNAFGFSPPA